MPEGEIVTLANSAADGMGVRGAHQGFGGLHNGIGGAWVGHGILHEANLANAVHDKRAHLFRHIVSLLWVLISNVPIGAGVCLSYSGKALGYSQHISARVVQDMNTDVVFTSQWAMAWRR